MTNRQEEFLLAYYKACDSSQFEDWLQAVTAAKRMYNEIRKPEDDATEAAIRVNQIGY